MTEINEKAIGCIVEGLLSSAKKETEDVYGELVDKILAKNEGRIKEASKFDILVNYSLDLALDNYIEKIFTNTITGLSFDKIALLYKYYGFVNRNVEELVIRMEGSSSCADKSRWLLRQYEEFLKTKAIPDMTIDEKCYWKPGFGTGEQWIEFCESLMYLYYGNPERYFKAFSSLITGK